MNKKPDKKIIILICAAVFLVALLCVCLFVPSVNNAIKKKEEEIAIDLDIKQYGFSARQIEKILNNTELVYDSYVLEEVSDKIILTPDESFSDSAFAGVEDFEYYGKISYLISDETVKSAVVDSSSFSINITVSKPEVNVEIYADEINYLDTNLGLLSINDLHLDEEELEQVKQFGKDNLEEKLNTQDNYNSALSNEEKLYEDVYSSILQDVEGISMLRINIEIED